MSVQVNDTTSEVDSPVLQASSDTNNCEPDKDTSSKTSSEKNEYNASPRILNKLIIVIFLIYLFIIICKLCQADGQKERTTSNSEILKQHYFEQLLTKIYINTEILRQIQK